MYMTGVRAQAPKLYAHRWKFVTKILGPCGITFDLLGIKERNISIPLRFLLCYKSFEINTDEIHNAMTQGAE